MMQGRLSTPFGFALMCLGLALAGRLGIWSLAMTITGSLLFFLGMNAYAEWHWQDLYAELATSLASMVATAINLLAVLLMQDVVAPRIFSWGSVVLVLACGFAVTAAYAGLQLYWVFRVGDVPHRRRVNRLAQNLVAIALPLALMAAAVINNLQGFGVAGATLFASSIVAMAFVAIMLVVQRRRLLRNDVSRGNASRTSAPTDDTTASGSDT